MSELVCQFSVFLSKPVELMNGTEREHSLICKGPVEVLVLDKEVRYQNVSLIIFKSERHIFITVELEKNGMMD